MVGACRMVVSVPPGRAGHVYGNLSDARDEPGQPSRGDHPDPLRGGIAVPEHLGVPWLVADGGSLGISVLEDGALHRRSALAALVHEKLAAILNVNYDVLEPYGYQETDPGTMWVNKPQLSIWASAMYNPVEYTSVFQNDLKGDKTHGATASVNYRYGHFSTQVSGYYKKNEGRDGNSSFESHGWQEQAGYYLVPGKLELAQRIDQVRWGRGQIAESGGKANQWYAGPANFSFNRLTEYTAGLNYYFVGHKAKTQLAYSYLDGKGFDGGDFDAKRLLLQAQVAF